MSELLVPADHNNGTVAFKTIGLSGTFKVYW